MGLRQDRAEGLRDGAGDTLGDGEVHQRVLVNAFHQGLRSCSSRAPALAPTEATKVSSSRRRAVFVFVASMAGSKLPVPRGSTINRVNANLSWWQGCHHRWRTRKRPTGGASGAKWGTAGKE